MTPKAKKKKPSESLLAATIKITAFTSPDPTLGRYTKGPLRDYISTCCERSQLIEAYSLAVQYAEEALMFIAGNPKLKGSEKVGRIIIAILYSLGKVDKHFYEQYGAINKTRADLTHDVVRKPDVREKLAQREDHGKCLRKFINLVDENFVRHYRDRLRKFVKEGKNPRKLSKTERDESNFFWDIAIHRAVKKIDPSKIDGDVLQDKVLEKAREEIKKALEDGEDCSSRSQ